MRGMRRTLALFYLCASVAPAAEVQGITGPVDTELTGPALQAAAQQKPAPEHRAEFSVSYFGGLNPSRGGSNMNITDAFLSVPVYQGTESPTLIAGRIPELNSSVSRYI